MTFCCGYISISPDELHEAGSYDLFSYLGVTIVFIRWQSKHVQQQDIQTSVFTVKVCTVGLESLGIIQ